MDDVKNRQRLAQPLMHVFRSAFRARNSDKSVEKRDEFGDRIVAGRRSSPRRSISEQVLREDLSDDLITLLNTVSLGSAVDLSDLDRVQKSVLNYGLADLTAITTEDEAIDALGTKLRAALRNFEPRLIAKSVSVERDTSIEDKELKVRFSIRADMHATPIDVPIDFVADLELETNKMKIFGV